MEPGFTWRGTWYYVCMTTQDLSHPLAREALAPAWSRYHLFPTFSWEWCVQRSRVFWPLALLYGMGIATWHAAGMSDWPSWPEFALRATIGALLVVSAGPLMAAAVRRAGFSPWLERLMVVLAILAGFGIAKQAMQWTNAHHELLMSLCAGRKMEVPYLFGLLSHLLFESLKGSSLMLIVGGGGFAIVSYLTERRRLAGYASRRELDAVRKQKDEAELRLSVLQAQVEPHFLFNTLASVRSLVMSDPQRAAATIDAMSDYLRSTLPSLDEPGTRNATLGRQVEICTRYLDLMNVRSDGRIRIEVDVEAAAQALFFPPLVLLTLAENAVKHGVEPKPGPATVRISASLRGDGALVVAVEDDGAGLRPGESHGLGLANVRAQLRNLFGNGAALSIGSREQGGTRAQIVVDRPAP
jgi:two-component sensor histidine kinase